MDYIKISFRIEPDNEIHREILIAELGAAGFESFAETEKVVEAYIPFTLYSENQNNYNLYFKKVKPFSINYIVEKIRDQNWNEIWEKNYFKPILINNQCLIRAPFHTDFPEAEYEIIIEPKMAFGTGYHETTFLMLSEILKINLAGKKVLDMGCGTGVLGILASHKGAASITFIDNDEWAFRNAMENASYNNISNFEVKLGGAELLNGEIYDLIFANINLNILLNDMNSYRNSLIKGGQLLISGFYLEELPDIQQKAYNLGLKYFDYGERNRWVVAKFILE
jgi:ribosomal protein L11 methyltransferase